MIGKLTGELVEKENDSIVLDVGGVGYLVFCARTLIQNLVIGDKYSVFIEPHIREDHIHLYGFLSKQDRVMFNLIQSVNGIGPKMALNILSALSIEQISTAILNLNKEAFRSISGVGQKIAERIIIELKGKIEDCFSEFHTFQQSFNSEATDAISALVNLGMSKTHAQKVVTDTLKQNPNASIDELIRTSLTKR